MRRKLPHELKLPRRTLLRGVVGGAAAALALPTLEAMLNDNGDALARGGELPRRLLTWVFGNGCRLDHWVPSQTGPSYTLTQELAPISSVRDYCRIMSGFRNYVAGRRGHHDGMAGIMSGRPFIQLDPQGAPYASKFSGESFDQIVADIVGVDTYFKSLQVGVSKRHLTNQGPTLMTMSHRGPDQPLNAERDPQALFDKLFNSFLPSDDPNAALRASTLDAVLMDAQRLKKRVSATDQARLDAHLEAIFELQKQILAIPPECDVPPKPDVDPFLPDGAEPLVELNEVMAKLVVMALSCDMTRVVSYMFTGPSGGAQFHMLPPSEFPEFPGAKDYSHADHHQISHFNLAYEQEFIHRSTIVSVQAFAHMLELFQSTLEGDGNLLDNSCILMFSDVAEGWNHSEIDFPIIVAGHAGGRLKQDVGHFRSPSEESVTNISLACIKAVIPEPDQVDQFGGSDGTYDGFTSTPCAAVLA
jgi:hypothetical protein